MTDRTDPPSARIAAALVRIEASAERLGRRRELRTDARYDRLRGQTQAALVALDQVIASVAAAGKN